MPDRTRYATCLALALIALGAWRVLAVVGASPLLGYGDQYDMRRTSACVGLWPDLSPVARQQAHPETPTARYVRGDRAAAECYPSSELLFVAPVAATLAPGESVDLRVIGVLKATILIVLALAFALMLRRRPAFGLAHAMVFAVVIADPMVTLWINTLYTEFAALLFAYASVVLLIALGSDAADAILRSRVKLAALMVALAGLGFSRQQHMLLPALLVLPLLASLWTSNRRMALTLLAGVCAIAFAQMFFVVRPATIAQANSVDVVLGAILPASRDESATARKLGLPDRCLRSVGASWYVTMGESLAAACPEALAVPKRRVALLAFTEPTTLLRMILRAVPHLQDWRLGYLGRVEGIAYGGGDAMREVAGPIAASIASWIEKIPRTMFMGALIAVVTLFAGTAFTCLLRTWRTGESAPAAPVPAVHLTLYALSAVACYAVASSIFGDGYVELPRHAHLAAVALCALALTWPMALLAPLFDGGGRDSLIGMMLVALSLAAAAPLQLEIGAASSVPMGLGGVDRPRQNVLPATTIEFAGWALDPAGVARVEIVAADGKTFAAQYGLAYAGARGEPLSLYYPNYPDVDAPGFIAAIPAAFFRPDEGGGETRTFVIAATGARTEIDRRRITMGTP